MGLGRRRTGMENALFMLGRHDEILSLRRKIYAADPERLAALERGYAEAGFEGALRHAADLSAARYEKSASRTGTASLTTTYLKAGDKDKAHFWLEKAFEDRDGNLPYIGRPLWAPLRGDPRFQSLVRRLGLPRAYSFAARGIILSACRHSERLEISTSAQILGGEESTSRGYS